MTPQEITDLATSVRERMVQLVRLKHAEEDAAIRAESIRVQALCATHTGHVFNPGNSLFSIMNPRRVCVFFGVAEPARQEV